MAKYSKIDGAKLSDHGTWPPANWIAHRVRELRKARGWSAQKLADRIAEHGYEGLDRNVIANLENGRRLTVSVEEWLVLSLALDVAPIHLLVPFTDDRVLVGHWDIEADAARDWIRGASPHPAQDERTFRTEVPEQEWQDFAGRED